MKVLWNRHDTKQASWEPEETIKSQYPNFFSGKNFEDELS